MTDTCLHDDLELGNRIDQMVDSDGTTYLLLRLSVRCQTCGESFSFAGLPSGIPNPTETVVSADGYEIRAPIYPRPGATVALLQSAGLEERLKEAMNGAMPSADGGLNGS
jgi:hypothetical protein